jgi:hypothetical protein
LLAKSLAEMQTYDEDDLATLRWSNKTQSQWWCKSRRKARRPMILTHTTAVLDYTAFIYPSGL